MNEPTLAELREMAQDDIAWIGDIDTPLKLVLEAFLTLTDPTPLTAEHCREAGLPSLLGRTFANGGPLLDATILADFRGPEPLLDLWNPTVGQLRLALLKENRDGE